MHWRIVLLPYEITLLSNRMWFDVLYIVFYYLIKLHYSQTKYGVTAFEQRFTTL